MLLVAVIDPITSSAHLRINTRPERNEFSLPKVTLKVAFERIGAAVVGRYEISFLAAPDVVPAIGLVGTEPQPLAIAAYADPGRSTAVDRPSRELVATTVPEPVFVPPPVVETAERAIKLPTERSMPAVRITKVIAIAIIPIGAMDRSISVRLAGSI